MTASSSQLREGCIVVGSLFNEPMRVETARDGDGTHREEGECACHLLGTERRSAHVMKPQRIRNQSATTFGRERAPMMNL
jgi:hypothetical protein